MNITLTDQELEYIELGLRLAHNMTWGHMIHASNERDNVQADRYEKKCNNINALYKKLYSASLISGDVDGNN